MSSVVYRLVGEVLVVGMLALAGCRTTASRNPGGEGAGAAPESARLIRRRLASLAGALPIIVTAT